MKARSRTGLQSSPTKRIRRQTNDASINLSATITPAPFIVKPYAGLYNPYSYGCSILCNHPTDDEIRKMLQNAKDNWGNDGRSYIFPDDVAAIRAELEQMNMKNDTLHSEMVPEELFRRYTETDSRPVTPAPTLASAHTRTSAATRRRCLTPDPIRTSEVREKTMLILDLRRSHSQETLSYYAGSAFNESVPLLKVTHMETLPQSSPHHDKRKLYEKTRLKAIRTNESKLLEPPDCIIQPSDDDLDADDDDDDNEELVKRRGKRCKRRKKKNAREASSVSSMFRNSIDPETLVAGISADSQNASGRPSLVPNHETLRDLAEGKRAGEYWLHMNAVDSFLDVDILRHLRRELTMEQIEAEFNQERRNALEEALKTIPSERIISDELQNVKNELNISAINTETLLKLPRHFRRSNVRFELPIDSRSFTTMRPLAYLNEYVFINSSNKALYNCVFNLCKIEEENQIEQCKKKRFINGTRIMEALGLVMGKEFDAKQTHFVHDLIGWDYNASYEFKQFCGIAAACERIQAKEFQPKLKDRQSDPCHDIEMVDFESLEYRLNGKEADDRLVRLLLMIKYE